MSRINKDFILMIFVPSNLSFPPILHLLQYILFFFLFLECFTGSPHYSLIKELFIKIFSTPYYHPKSKPFIDHMFYLVSLTTTSGSETIRYEMIASNITIIGAAACCRDLCVIYTDNKY